MASVKFRRETEPTMLPGWERSEKLGRCPVCGNAVYSDERVIVLDGSDTMIHENCAVFRRDSLTAFLDLIGVDYYTGDAKEMTEGV